MLGPPADGISLRSPHRIQVDLIFPRAINLYPTIGALFHGVAAVARILLLLVALLSVLSRAGPVTAEPNCRLPRSPRLFTAFVDPEFGGGLLHSSKRGWVPAHLAGTGKAGATAPEDGTIEDKLDTPRRRVYRHSDFAGRRQNWPRPYVTSEKEFGSANDTSSTVPRRWRRPTKKWLAMLGRLEAYRDGPGDGSCSVPQVYPQDPHLGKWVAKQRLEYTRMNKGGTAMTPEKIEILERIGFVFQVHKQAWEDRRKDLAAYKIKHGDCLVPFQYAINPGLGHWVVGQRQLYAAKLEGKSNGLSDYRVAVLEGMGFVWNALDEYWEARFDELVCYKEEHGDCAVTPRSAGDNPSFMAWIQQQRDRYKIKYGGKDKKSYLTDDQVRRLDALGFLWDPQRTRWETRFAELRAYVRRTGSAAVRVNDGSLGNWVMHQRVQYARRRRGKLSPLRDDQIQALDSVGFVWRVGGYSWYDCFEQLAKHAQETGSADVPSDYWDRELVKWIADQRYEYPKYRTGDETELTDDRVEDLEDIGFNWGTEPYAERDGRRYREMNGAFENVVPGGGSRFFGMNRSE